MFQIKCKDKIELGSFFTSNVLKLCFCKGTVPRGFLPLFSLTEPTNGLKKFQFWLRFRWVILALINCHFLKHLYRPLINFQKIYVDAYSTNKELHFAFFKVFVLKQFPGGQITKEVSFFKLGITRRNRKIESIFTRWQEAQMYSMYSWRN